MESILSTAAFTLLIGGQFLATIVLISKRKLIYSGLDDHEKVQHPPGSGVQSQSVEMTAKTA